MPARRKPPPDTSSLPRYAQVHQSLLADIRLGKYPVGSRLPTEDELGQIYGVSRHTVREATRKLVDSGLISRHPSIGTLVRATRPLRPMCRHWRSLKGLLDYNNTTRLEVLSSRRVNADAAMANELRCRTRIGMGRAAGYAPSQWSGRLHVVYQGVFTP